MLIGQTLTRLALGTKLLWQALLHTYLSLPEIEQAKIEGFHNVPYLDQVGYLDARSTDVCKRRFGVVTPGRFVLQQGT